MSAGACAPGHSSDDAPIPDELEILANLLLGSDDRRRSLPLPTAGGVRAALDRVLVPALRRRPCLVSFSGGRDSSAVLALACDVARRHGLDLPVPAIMRFPGAPESDERQWQEMVMSHLGIGAHEVVTLGDELDAVGPVATAFLARHGVRWPGNAHMHTPMVRLAAGGTILTGVGGDELFETSAPPRRRRARLLAGLPQFARAAVLRRRRPLDGYGWLSAAGRRRVAVALSREEVSWPYPWDAAMDHWYRSRAYRAMGATLNLVGSAWDVDVVNPLIAADVLVELRAQGGARGFASRTHAMRWLVGDLLPPEVVERRSKAVFTAPLWGQMSRAFISGWDGSGIDSRWVDVAEVRRELGAASPDARMVLLVQTAWLATHES